MAGEWRQPDESLDEYCDRVDREVREAGEAHHPLGFMILLYLVIVGIVGFTAWKVLWS